MNTSIEQLTAALKEANDRRDWNDALQAAQRLQAEARRIQRLEQWKVIKNVVLTFAAWCVVVLTFALLLGA